MFILHTSKCIGRITRATYICLFFFFSKSQKCIIMYINKLMKHTSPSSDGVAAVVKVLNLVSDGVLTIIVSFHLMIE